MNPDSYINQILSNWPSILTSIIISIGGCSVFTKWVLNRNLQSQKSKLDTDLEKIKSRFQLDIQNHYFNTQQRVTSLYKCYPEIHKSLKQTEGAVYCLVYRKTTTKKEAFHVWREMTATLAEHSLFLSDTLSKYCVDAKDTLLKPIQSHSSMKNAEKDELMEEVYKKVDLVTDMMKKELLEDNYANKKK